MPCVGAGVIARRLSALPGTDLANRTDVPDRSGTRYGFLNRHRVSVFAIAP